MLDAHQLNVFVVAAETLNFTKAAQKLHMSQPSVSQHIQTLERHFDTKLFDRSGRNLQLTDAGRSLLPLSRDLIKQSILIEEAMASLQGEVFGHLIVGCSTTPGKYVLPHLLANFHRQYPKVNFTCQVSSQFNAIKSLCDGEIHFALSSHIADHCNETEFIKFMCENIILIAPPEHPWAKKKEITLDELFQADFILREEESGTFLSVKDALSERGVDIRQLRTLLTLGNSEAIALSVQEGLGVGFVSNTVVDKLCQGKVVPIDVEGLDICRDIFIGRNNASSSTNAQVAFWEFITSLSTPISSSDYLPGE